MSDLPPFPVDDATLDMLWDAMDPWNHGDPDAETSSVWPFLDMMSRMAGSDPEAVLEDHGDIQIMRDPLYEEHAVIRALITEIRRLRGIG